MRLLTLLAALGLFAGCTPAQPFDLVITNGGDAPTFLSAGEGSGVLVGIQEEIGSTWFSLSSSLEGMCVAECGQLPGPIVCADMAAELTAVYGLLPGESVTKSFDGELWYYDTLNRCARPAPLTGALRAGVCHGTSAMNDYSGETIDDIDQSGLLDASSGGTVLNAECDEFDFTVSEPAVTVID